MALKLYNTLSRRKEEFVPLKDNIVNFYSCGPTVYDYFHIGNARPLIMFDIFRRYMEYRGFNVNYIVNITDIDDKIIKRAASEGTDFRAITRRFTEAFFEGCEKLGVRPATVHPRATDNISEMIDFIGKLLAKGHAYCVEGDVYYDISSFPEYGKLSGRDIEKLLSGARVEIDEKKKNPLDFALWKASKPEEPSWESPWGAGRPGWHIECSVMSMRYAGDTLDIHAGGQDLIFPHHENEIAQSEGATGKPFSRYWLHNGFLDIEGEKMSKSLGNFLTVRDILKRYDPMAIRVFFLLKHYRSPIDFSEERIIEAQSALERLRNAYRKITFCQSANNQPAPKPETASNNEEILKLIGQNKQDIIEAMDDDFNTAKSMGHLFEIARIVNSQPENSPGNQEIMQAAKVVFDTIGNEVFGIEFDTSLPGEGLAEDLMSLIIELRAQARKDKNWAMSDRIRDMLEEKGITLEDRPDGTLWKRENKPR
jgi:cysteinyl-tRNA synthetase